MTTLPLFKSTATPTCYFTYEPHQSSASPTPSVTTPASPTHPLLADRPCIPSLHDYGAEAVAPRMDFSNILRLQTQAAHGPVLQRPRAVPTQDSESSSSCSVSSASSARSSATPPSPSCKPPSIDLTRCVRCKRAISIDATNRTPDVISFGSLHYCNSCALILEERLQ